MAFRNIDLGAQQIGEVTLFEALLMTDCVRMTLVSDGVGAKDYWFEGIETPNLMRVGRAVTATGALSGGEVKAAWPDGSAIVQPRAPEPAFFAGRNVGLALRTEDRAQTARDWIAWHKDHHGMTGALIVDRAASPGFGAALRDLTEDFEDFALMVVRPGVPLGRADLGREGAAQFAPDAPRRENLAPPEPDPWLSPLADVAIFEALRHRFLSNAHGVMNLDLSDLLAKVPGGEDHIFDVVQDRPGGVLALVGRHAYPWKLPKGRPTGFGDHTCLSFDRVSYRRRWCVAPNKAAPETHWRLLRIAGAEADLAQAKPFWRAMALKHPGAAVSTLVPKAGLREAPDLMTTTAAIGDVTPARMPKAKLRKTKAPGTVTLITSMKNEGPFILDWIAWHRAIGTDHFLIYSNDCTDGTEEILTLLDQVGVITHRNNDGYKAAGLTPQHAVLAAAASDPVTEAGDWIAFVDCDEFINIKRGAGRFADLFEAVPDANMISMTWRLFGNADRHPFEDRPVFDQFDLCAPELCRRPHQAWGFKTLFRNLGIYRKLGVHRPKGLVPQLVDHIHWVNGSGAKMPPSLFRTGWRSNTATYGYDLVQLNHYAVRSAESFLVKRERGRANHITRDQGLGYWFRMNHNQVKGGVNPAVRQAFEAERARLLEYPGVQAAHDAAVAHHRARIEALRADPVYAEFYAALTGPRMERMSRLLGHFGAGVFQSGPSVVPDERVFGDWKDGDFFTVPLPEDHEQGFGD